MISGCRVCRPELDPQGPRKGEHHFAVRFGAEECLMTVVKDGAEIHDVYEVEAPDGGRASEETDTPGRNVTGR